MATQNFYLRGTRSLKTDISAGCGAGRNKEMSLVLTQRDNGAITTAFTIKCTTRGTLLETRIFDHNGEKVASFISDAGYGKDTPYIYEVHGQRIDIRDVVNISEVTTWGDHLTLRPDDTTMKGDRDYCPKQHCVVPRSSIRDLLSGERITSVDCLETGMLYLKDYDRLMEGIHNE